MHQSTRHRARCSSTACRARRRFSSANLAGTADDLTISPFTYNPASQVTSQTRSNDAYSSAGSNPIVGTYSSNGLNQYVQSGTIVPSYDERGNLTSAGPTTYGYNSENRLISATGAASASLAYDPLNRLYQLTSGPATTRFTYDGLDPITEYNGSNLVLRRYVHGPGIDQPVAWYEGSSTTDRRFLHGDERGSIIAVTDAGGALIAANRYDEYGVPGATNLGRFQYTGQMWLPEPGVHYYKNRLYSATLGRFLQTDPIGFEGGINLYAYVLNDPINLLDPLGLQPPYCADPACETIAVPGIPGAPIGGGGRGGYARYNITDLAKKPGCSSPGSSTIGTVRQGLEWLSVGADALSIGATATGIGAPIGGLIKGVQFGLELGIFGINLYDTAQNGEWANGAGQVAGRFSMALIPGAKLGNRLRQKARLNWGQNANGTLRKGFQHKIAGQNQAIDSVNKITVENSVASVGCEIQ